LFSFEPDTCLQDQIIILFPWNPIYPRVSPPPILTLDHPLFHVSSFAPTNLWAWLLNQLGARQAHHPKALLHEPDGELIRDNIPFSPEDPVSFLIASPTA
jgi:hypothetical protein